MKKSIVLIFTFLISVFSINAQRTTSVEVKHATYGKAIVESNYNANDVLIQKLTYTTDTVFTKEYKEIGEITYYNEKGKLQAKGDFFSKKNDENSIFNSGRKKNGNWSFFTDEGKLTGTINYENNIKEGIYIFYHKNGKVAHTGTYVQGQNTGTENVFFNNGQLHKSVAYKEGSIYNILSFMDKEGNKINHGTLKDGNGTLQNYDLVTGKLLNTYTLEDGMLNIIDTKILKTAKGEVTEKRYKNSNGGTKKIVRTLNNKLEGLQESYNYKGQLEETINYSKGIKNGKHTKFNDNGTLFYEYTYVNEKKIGAYKFTPEGFKDKYYVLDEGFYDENQKFTGKFTRYLQDKKEVVDLGKMNTKKIVIESGTYKNHIKTGIWKTFDESGKLIKETNFSNNKKDLYVKKEYFKDKKTLKSIVEYDNQKDEGLKKVYYENGQLKFSATYKNEELDGAYKEFYDNGQLKEVGQREKGRKIGNWKGYNEEGKIEHDNTYSLDYCCFPSKRIAYFYRNDGTLSSIIIQSDKKKNPLNENESYFGTTINKNYSENGILRELKSKKKVNYNSYGVLNGLYQLFYATGELNAEGYYKNDKEDGIWIYNDFEGKLKRKVTYVLGDEIGSIESYEYYPKSKNKSKASIGINSKDKSTRTITRYYDTGIIEEVGNYMSLSKSNLSGRDGLWKSYYENGNLKEERFYEIGKKVGTWKQYNEKGKVSKRTKHK
ncbi:hypothetical protein M4I21_10485 [Cellulophaga sp. 20_2_10]|uniref:toxin-antitoxin system YwqK family antitoxin n=1 Tax=Cellulophaga sp. 20_2_10 TaxID=2942476 RepID=UPI00201AB83A|nr:hypothetical protein [Cellulophaga sp. 20_2_10]MCL5246236.1 hypothetical protein [Cellulophaga sp. 20_2_10]